MDLSQRVVQFNGDGMAIYRFSFIPNGTAAPTLIGGKYIVSAKRTGTGAFTITAASNFGAVLCFKYGIREITGGPLAGMTVQLDPSVTSTTASGGAVIGIRLCTASTGASADFTSSTTGASVDVELTLGTDPNNLV